MGEAQKEELAADRTDLAEDRTLLANERTFAGWLRTGLGAVAVGLAFQALFERIEPPWVPKAIATAFMATGILIFLLAERNSRKVLDRLRPHEVRAAGAVQLAIMTWALVSAAAALIVALWLARIG